MTQLAGWLLLRVAEAQIALMTLTRLPSRRLKEPAPTIAAASWAFPLVGFIVGGFATGGFALALTLNLPIALAALVTIAIGIMLTGAVHEDGLADFSDGLGGGATAEQKLAIMRDSRIGSYGVLALILAFATRVVCMTSMVNAVDTMLALVALAVASRSAMVAMLYLIPPARTDGLGLSAAQVGRWRCVVALVCGLGSVIAMIDAWPAAVVTMAATCALLGWLAVRQIGGQTGDVLGATQQLTEIAGWVAILSWSRL